MDRGNEKRLQELVGCVSGAGRVLLKAIALPLLIVLQGAQSGQNVDLRSSTPLWHAYGLRLHLDNTRWDVYLLKTPFREKLKTQNID